jgi:hypothetical protein
MENLKLPENIPSSFIRKRWEDLVFTENGINRKFYELCLFSELKNHLRSGDLWVQGSRQYKDFEDYLIPVKRFTEMRDKNTVPLDVVLNAEEFLSQRMEFFPRKYKLFVNLLKTMNSQTLQLLMTE